MIPVILPEPEEPVIVCKLDRQGRSMRHLIDLVTECKDMGVQIKRLQDNIDTISQVGTMIILIFAAHAQFERELISERTKAGIASSDRKGGRPKGLSIRAQDKARLAESFFSNNKKSIVEICELLDISKPTFYRYLGYRGVKINNQNR